MTNEVLEQVIRGYMATDQPVYSFGWQGGEPTLMGLKFFRLVTGLQQKHGRPGSRVANGLQTNGTMISPELARHLADHRFLVGLSIDGPAGLHDRYRKPLSGRGTHSQVLAGLETLRAAGVDVNALVLVSQANVRSAGDVYRYLKSEGLLYHQYIPCVEFEPDGSPSPFTIAGEEWGRFLMEIFDLWNVRDTRRVSIRHHDALMAFFMDGSRSMCTMGGSCSDYFVVEHNGDVYPCDFYVERDLSLGNVMDRDWAGFARSPVRTKFATQKAGWAEVCNTCSHLQYCSGDCLKNRENSPKGAGSWLCDGWRLFYDHAAPELRNLTDQVARSRGLDGPVWRPEKFDPELPCFCGSGRKARNCHLKSLNQSTTP